VSVAALLVLSACASTVTVTAEDGGSPASLGSEAVSPGSIPGSLAASEPTPSSTTAPPTTEPPRTRLVVNGVGDTNLDPGYIGAFQSAGYELAFSGLQDAFLRDDLTIVNLECAASAGGIAVPKQFNFNCDLDALPVARDAGVEVANLANNHSGDYGPDALMETRANVAAAGIAPVGVGSDAAEAAEPALFEINGWTVAVVGFGGVVPSAGWLAGPESPGMADGDDLESMVATVEAADELADLVLVTIHWGVELDLTPRPEDVVRAHALIEAGADAIFGHHPHRLQPLEFYNDRPIAWSLGNFVWPRLSAAGATSAIAQVVVEPDGSVDACLIPVVIESSGHPVVQVELDDPCSWHEEGESAQDTASPTRP
jgi:poly-gamma-glutamate synthesis protein (capsule biosynthesis protein)